MTRVMNSTAAVQRVQPSDARLLSVRFDARCYSNGSVVACCWGVTCRLHASVATCVNSHSGMHIRLTDIHVTKCINMAWKLLAYTDMLWIDANSAYCTTVKR